MTKHLYTSLLSMLVLLATALPVLADAPMIPNLPWEKRSDWLDIKTDITPAAKGDGVADDTAALQAGFTAMKDGSVLYLPAGTYRITRTLILGEVGFANTAIIGNGRATRIVWDGAADASMIKELGDTHSNLIGFVLDGRGKAGTGLQHSATTRFGTNMLCRHLAFLNMTDNGVSVGLPIHRGAGTRAEGLETAETVFDNCLFDHCFRGMYIGEYNDYDFVYQGCEFRDCIEGLVDFYGCDYVRDCHFERNKIADIVEHGVHGCAVWRCTSYDSGLFLDYSIPAASYVMQDCCIDAWHDRRGAVLLNGAPIAITDCSIGGPSDALYPADVKADQQHSLWSVKILGKEAQRVVLSDDSFDFKGKAIPLTRTAVLGDSGLGFDCGRVYEIPASARHGCLLHSARQSFLKTSVPMPGKLFDAKRDFGAKGDGRTDDTEAIRKTIDAARTAGHGAVAYLPRGQYRITGTLEIGGADWTLAGAAVAATALDWADRRTVPPSTSPTRIISPSRIWPSRRDGTATMPRTSCKLPPAPGPRSSPMTGCMSTIPSYDDKTKHPAEYYRRRGLHWKGLGKDDVVLVNYLGGNAHVEDSAAATILFEVVSGAVVVEGKSKERGGCVGALTKFSGGEDPCMLIKDSNSFVAANIYMESTPSNITVTGNPGDPPGRVTIQGAKYQRGGAWSHDNPACMTDNYHGEVNILFDSMCDGEEAFRMKSDNPCSLLLLGNYFSDGPITVQKSVNAQFLCLANESYKSKTINFECPPALQDSDITAAAPQAAHAFDDLRRLGEIDLQINYPEGILRQD